jgi:two-component system response regulator RegA
MLVATDFNISEAARRLGMHRRTLARKLDKKQVR